MKYPTTGRLTLGQILINAALIIVLVFSWGYCVSVHVRCARRGGTVLKNYLDMPVCVDLPKP